MILTLSNARGEVLNVAGATFENYQALRPIMGALGVTVELTDDLGRKGIASGSKLHQCARCNGSLHMAGSKWVDGNGSPTCYPGGIQKHTVEVVTTPAAETPPRTPLGELLFNEHTSLVARAAKAWGSE